MIFLKLLVFFVKINMKSTLQNFNYIPKNVYSSNLVSFISRVLNFLSIFQVSFFIYIILLFNSLKNRFKYILCKVHFSNFLSEMFSQRLVICWEQERWTYRTPDVSKWDGIHAYILHRKNKLPFCTGYYLWVGF